MGGEIVNKMSESIGALQAVMLLISAAGIVNHVIIIPLLLQTAGRDSWVAALLAVVPHRSSVCHHEAHRARTPVSLVQKAGRPRRRVDFVFGDRF